MATAIGGSWVIWWRAGRTYCRMRLRLREFPGIQFSSQSLVCERFVRQRHLARAYFKTERGRALFAGLAAHSMLPLEKLTTSAVALVLAVAGHAAGWPFARGGSQQLTAALVKYLESLGGQRDHELLRGIAGATSPGASDSAGRDAAAINPHGGRQAAGFLPAKSGAFQVWSGRLQAGLGFAPAGAMARDRMRAGRDGASRRERWRKSASLNGSHGREKFLTVLMCCSRRPACLIHRALRQGSTRRGVTAMSPTVLRAT